MTLKQMKEATLKLIEEYDETELTLDEDIKTKLNSSINIVMFECSRMKKIYGKTSLSVLEDDEVTFSDIDEQMYQLEMIRGVDYEVFGNIITFKESGIADIYFTKFPIRINDNTIGDQYVFELDQDIQEIMPYGIAGDVLKSDPSSQYGIVFSKRFEEMMTRLDPSKTKASLNISTMIGSEFL